MKIYEEQKIECFFEITYKIPAKSVLSSQSQIYPVKIPFSSAPTDGERPTKEVEAPANTPGMFHVIEGKSLQIRTGGEKAQVKVTRDL